MQTYKDLVELARICFEQAGCAINPEVAAELIRMAKEYERRATARKEAGFADQASPNANS